MKKRVLVIFTDNQYQVTFEMLKRAALYMEQNLEYEVCCCGPGASYESMKHGEWDFILSAQGVEFAFLHEPDGRMHVTWLCDHPISTLARFKDFPDKDHMLIGCVDETHPAFLRKYYGIPNACFLPHFGWKAEHDIPYAKRSIDVFFPASYSLWEEEVASRYEGLDGPLKVIAKETISYLLAHDDISLEDGFDTVLRNFGEQDTEELTRACTELIGEYVNSYWRHYYHDHIIGTLLQAGVHLTVCGRNWEQAKLKLPCGQNITVLSENMPYLDVIEKIADSRMVLNIVPSFKAGAHERIAMAALNGAVCLTDDSRYISDLFRSSVDAVIYDRKNPAELASKIQYLLANPHEAEIIAENGRKTAAAHLTVDCFVEKMLKELL